MPPRKTQAEPEAKKPARRTPAKSTQKYARAIYGTPTTVKLSDGSRLDFRPRGQRGDLIPVSKEVLADPKFLQNVGLIIEIVSAAEAKSVIENQSVNQQAYHPALQILRDPNGDPYAQTDIRVEADPQTQGDTVAYVEDGKIVRSDLPRPPRSVGPNVASQGFTGSDAEMPGLIDADDAARNNTDLEGVLHGFNVER